MGQAIDIGLVTPKTVVNTQSPMVWGKYKIRDYKNYGRELSIEDVIVKSSNVGTARVALDTGA